MTAGFRTRKVKSDTSIGDRLKRARVRQKLSVTEVEEATKIRSKFITALESDCWDQIPSEVYGRGYLETYAAYLKLPVDEIMHDYDKMRSMYARHCKQHGVELAPQQTLKLPRFVLTPRLILVLVICAGTLGFAAEVGAQMKRYTSSPFLNLQLVSEAQAKEVDGPELIVNADTVTIKGKTVPGAIVKVNNQVVSVTDEGDFAHDVRVEKGLNAVVVESTSQNGKKTSQVLSVIAK